MSRIWAKLTHVGGSEESLAVPSILNLSDDESFFGRFSQPAAKSDQPFTHTTQHVIACLFVSSTHFGIIRDCTIQPFKYYVRDYSRNGTFLNSVLIGTKERKELSDGDTISLRYKDKDKIIYQFTVLPTENQNAEGTTGAQSQAEGETSTTTQKRKEASSSNYPLKKTDSTSEIFTQQITNLQTEIKRLENKLSLTNDQIELITKENEKLIRKSRQDEKQLQTNKSEIDDYKDRIQTLETTNHTLEARNRVLQENYDDLLLEFKEMKNKNTFYINELQEKNQLLENHRQVMDDQNKLITNEKRLKNSLEINLQEMKTKLQIYEEKHIRLTNANQALQRIVDDFEQSNNLLQDSLLEKLQYIEQIEKISRNQKDQLDSLNLGFGQLFPLIQTLQGNLQSIEQIPQPSFPLELPRRNLPTLQDQEDDDETMNQHTQGHVNLQQLEQGDLFSLHLIHPNNQQDTLEESFQIHLPIPMPDVSNEAPNKRQPSDSNASTPQKVKPQGSEFNNKVIALPTIIETTQAPEDDEEEEPGHADMMAVDVYAPMNEETAFHEAETIVPSQPPTTEVMAPPSSFSSSSTSMKKREPSKVDQIPLPFDELVEGSKNVIVKEFDPNFISQESAIIRKSVDTTITNISRISDITSASSSKNITPAQKEGILLSQEGGKKAGNSSKDSKTSTPNKTKDSGIITLSQVLSPNRTTIPPSQQSATSERRKSTNKRSRALSEEAEEDDDDDTSSRVSEQLKSPPVSQTNKKQKTSSSVHATPSKQSSTSRKNTPSSITSTATTVNTGKKTRKSAKELIIPQNIEELFPENDDEDYGNNHDKKRKKKNGSGGEEEEGTKSLERKTTVNSFMSSSRSFPNNDVSIHQMLDEDDEDRQRTAYEY
eukprot:gene10712-11670_t